jgi:hypothetical protein
MLTKIFCNDHWDPGGFIHDFNQIFEVAWGFVNDCAISVWTIMEERAVLLQLMIRFGSAPGVGDKVPTL